MSKNTKNIIDDLVHVISLIDDDYALENEDFKFNDIKFFVQKGYELFPVWYVRKEVVVYDNGENSLWVTFRPNLKVEPYKPDFLRTSYNEYNIGRDIL